MAVRNNRGMPVRMLRYNRTPADETKEYIERSTYDALGRLTSRIDARFFGAAGSPAPNFAYVSSLAGRVLRADSIDAGTHWTLPDVDGRPVWACDGRGTTTTFTYDALGRPLTVQETFDKQTPAIRDRWIYGETLSDAQAYNLRGRCIYRYDTAGELRWSGFRLTGQPVDETRQLLADAEGDPDWSGQTPGDLAGALDATPYQTAWTHDATGTWVTQTDAKGNVQQRGFDVAGRLASSSLTLAGGTAKPVLSAIDYSAAGQVLSETAGNGVVSTHAYEPETQRLIGLTVTRPAQAGRATVVQDLSYVYDPVGNVVQICDAAQATSYWRNQKIQAAHTYVYDALYQLVSASGREMANRGQQAQGLPPAAIPLPTDDSVYANYSRTYTYDPGGNLAAIQHQGAANYTQAIVISDTSNHALMQNGTATLTPANIDDGKNTWFDATGNQRRLVPDAPQTLAWDGRNRLRRVPLVSRPQDVNSDDRETYQYGSDDMRVRKRRTTVASGTTRTAEAIYLPGLTLRITASGDGTAMTVVESVQEVSSEAGSIQARCLHWDTGQPTGLANDLVRYGMGDLNRSISLELDDQAALISREEYYPYGGTAVWAARSQVEADTKFLRYSGKERDATGLYYYGYRYYQPWIGRWLNTDPGGTVDGMNLYRMVRNNPVTLVDPDGLAGEEGGHPGFSSRIRRFFSSLLCWRPLASANTTHGEPANDSAASDSVSGASPMPQHYAITPFKRDLEDFHGMLVESNRQKLSRGKPMLLPVFTGEAQRSKFHEVAERELAEAWKIPHATDRNKDEVTLAAFLEESSKKENALIGFSRIRGPKPRAYLWGHSDAGDSGLASRSDSSDETEEVEVETVADMLKEAGLPSDADLRGMSCFSAAGYEYPADHPNWLEFFHEGTLADRYKPGSSFMAALTQHLLNRGLKNISTSGYHLEIAKYASRVILKGGGRGEHMAGMAKSMDGKLLHMVRRRDVRVTIRS